MFGPQDFAGEYWAARRGRQRGWQPGFHRRRRHGSRDDDSDGFRGGRMLGQGELRLIMLALIAEQPRHGYEIIKLIEEKTEGAYSPSPGIVYPTLTFLEESDYVTAKADESKKLYSITADGRAFLKDNRELADIALERLAAAGTRYRRSRREEEARRGPALPPLVHAAFDNLLAAIAERIGRDAEEEAKVVDLLARAAIELRRKK